MILRNYRKVAEEVVRAFSVREPLGYLHPDLAATAQDDIGCVTEPEKRLRAFPSMTCLTFSLKVRDRKAATFMANVQQGAEDAFYDIYYKPIAPWGDSGLGRDILRRIVSSAIEQNFSHITTNVLPLTSARYFHKAGFIILEGPHTVHEQIAAGQTLADIRAAHQIEPSQLNALSCRDLRAVADLKDQAAITALRQGLQL